MDIAYLYSSATRYHLQLLNKILSVDICARKEPYRCTLDVQLSFSAVHKDTVGIRRLSSVNYGHSTGG